MGLNGALLQIISHGFIGAALFFLAGTTYDRIRLVYLDEMGGIAIPMPKIFTMFSSFSMASLALPGMSGFVVLIDSEHFFLDLDYGYLPSYNKGELLNFVYYIYFCRLDILSILYSYPILF
ncbi:hypothetical protein CASFOL_007944 [Castilleja foliolosa]|uniref:NADH:quinone oxidoreductase/Mrp antiporter transmembrane domain-containing protein n=1 Tax=Castilleja foliolosa TaxID=1961234 RepID=A0ABD3E606_9LAMI